MTFYETLRKVSNTTLLQMLLYGEARGEPIDGLVGVAWVVKNRANNPNWWGANPKDVMLKPKQFSCFNEDDPNLEKIRRQYPLRFTDPIMKLCRLVGFGVLYDWIPDNVEGANHYCHVDITPDWTKGKEPVKVIGNHKFYLL